MLPDTVHRVMDLMQDPQADPAELARTVQEDPGLALQTLHLCNSPFYSLPVEVTSIEHAIRLLGISTVCGLVMAAHFHGLVSRYTGPAAEVWLKGARRHFLEVAECCRFLVGSLGAREAQSEAFTVGPLHDIGKLVLAQLGVREAQAVREAMAHGDLFLVDAEMEVLETDHAEVGALLADRWVLPGEIVDVVQYHHVPERSQSSLAYFTFLADAFCRSGKDAGGLSKVLDSARVENWLEGECGLGWSRLEELAVRWWAMVDVEGGSPTAPKQITEA